MKAQQELRVPKRLPCDVKIAGLRHTGLVLNVSPRGLFVQTSAEAKPGSEISIDLTPPKQRESVELRATVVWKRTVPRQMLTAARGGMGLRILDAPEDYYTFLFGVIGRARPASSSPSAEPITELPTPRDPIAPPISKQLKFRVRVNQLSGPRSRYVKVTASSPRQAGRRALEEVGEGWQVLEVKLC